MTRPRKATVDYFPHACNHGKTMFIIEEQWGNDGYAFWFKLLEILGSSEKHFYDAGNPAAWRFLTAKTRVTSETAADILQCLADLDAIDPELWVDKIIWSKNFVDGIKDVYRKRAEDIPIRPDNRSPKSHTNGISGAQNPQSKLNKSKVNKTRVKDLSDGEPSDRHNGFDLNSLAQLWNEKKPPELPAVNVPFTRKPKQLEKLKDSIKRNPDILWWIKLLEKIHYSSFMRGKNNRGWKANFDFVVDNANEIADGKYIDNGFNQLSREEKNFLAAQQFVAEMENGK